MTWTRPHHRSDRVVKIHAADALLVIPFLISGIVHLARPQVFTPIMPRILPAQRELVIASGIAELLCAAGLVTVRTRRIAGAASAALLLAVFPANLKMAADAQKSGSSLRRYGTVARLPLQLPLVFTAVKAARGR